MEHRLTSEERVGLERDGYVLRRAVFDGDEVAEITASCEELVRRARRRSQGPAPRVRQLCVRP